MTPPDSIRLGALVLPEHQGPESLAIWRHVEELGFDHAWTFDHLSWRTLRDQPWFDGLTTLAAAACVTERIGLGTLVTSPNFRHPVTLAKQVMTLDHLSGGRFLLGVGAGAPGPDATVLGGPEPAPVERAARFEEFVTLCDQLLRRPVTTFRGRFYNAVQARMVPGCLQRPRVPLAVAAAGPRGMRLAVDHADIWVSYGPPGDPGAHSEQEAFAAARAQLRRLTEICEQAGRDIRTLRRLLHVSRLVPGLCRSAERIVDVVGRCHESGFTDVVIAYPRRDGVLAGDPAAFEHAAGRLLGGRMSSPRISGECSMGRETV